MKYIRVVSLVLLTLLILRLPDIAAGGFLLSGAKAESPARLGIFSWQKNNASDEALRDEMLETLARIGVSEVYQTLDVKTAPSFIRRAREKGSMSTCLPASRNGEWTAAPKRCAARSAARRG